MKDIFILYPINLYKINYIRLLEKNFIFYLVEEPIYFGCNEYIKKFIKLKLILHRASMKYYYDYLKKYNFECHYIDYKYVDKFYSSIKKKNITIYDPNDHRLINKLKKLFENIIIYDSPNFISTINELNEYNLEHKEKYFHKTFYEWQLKKYKNKYFDLMITKSYDKYNRESLPNNIILPKLIKNDNDTKYVIEAKKYISELFPNNYGNIDNFIFPITHKTSEKWLKNFINNKLKYFGKYEDAISKDENFIYHSCLSPMINIGLLNPNEIIKDVYKYYIKHRNEKNIIDINNYEGYIRQILGWREYMRFVYIFQYDKLSNLNYFNNNKLLDISWYNATTGIEPIDNTINKTLKYGYLHHIERLMVISNFMNLYGISPKEMYKWFMELFIDSYDWVMIGNISMGSYNAKNLITRKPYISSDNYIMKMSNYPKGTWNNLWHNLYHKFIKKNKTKLRGTYYH